MSLAAALVTLAAVCVPAVAAVRESSIVIALVLLAVTGREQVTPRQWAGAVAVAGGVACVVLG